MYFLDFIARTANVTPTVGSNVSMVPYPRTTTHHNQKYRQRIKIIDLSGEREFREQSWSDYYDEIHGLIFVIDANDSRRLIENKRILIELLENDKLRNKPVLM